MEIFYKNFLQSFVYVLKQVPIYFSVSRERCDGMQMFYGLQNFTWLSIAVRGSTTEFLKRFLVDFLFFPFKNHWTQILQVIYAWVYIMEYYVLKQVPIYFSGSRKRCDTVLPWSSANVLWTTELHRIFHWREREYNWIFQKIFGWLFPLEPLNSNCTGNIGLCLSLYVMEYFYFSVLVVLELRIWWFFISLLFKTITVRMVYVMMTAQRQAMSVGRL